MRQVVVTLCSLMLSVLALVGGSSSTLLCLHEAGIFHLAGSADEEHGSASASNDTTDACDTDSLDSCDWCLDLEVTGLELADVRYDDEADGSVAVPTDISAFSVPQWEIPNAIFCSHPPARAPPQALIVARTTVLLI